MARTTTTKRGTPCSSKWTSAWIEYVELLEDRLDRRICGAEIADGACELESRSANGRCRFHGGAAHIGAPEGNVNALSHGLHARRLRPCGASCPHWDTCPKANPDIEALPASKRPACVFESAAFDQVLHAIFDALSIDPRNPHGAAQLENVPAAAFAVARDRVDAGGIPDLATQMLETIEEELRLQSGKPAPNEPAPVRHTDAHPAVRMARIVAVESAEAYALSKVMTQRAASLVAGTPLADTVEETGDHRVGKVTTISGAATAYNKFQREQRNWLHRVESSAENLLKTREEFYDDPQSVQEYIQKRREYVTKQSSAPKEKTAPVKEHEAPAPPQKTSKEAPSTTPPSPTASTTPTTPTTPPSSTEPALPTASPESTPSTKSTEPIESIESVESTPPPDIPTPPPTRAELRARRRAKPHNPNPPKPKYDRPRKYFDPKDQWRAEKKTRRRKR